MPRTVTTPQEEHLLVEHTIARICGMASGSMREECVRNCPRDVYFIGSLRPEDSEEESGPFPGDEDEDTEEEIVEDIDAEDDRHQSHLIQELRRKLSPVAFGGEFLIGVQPPGASVSVEVQWVCYYRVFPTLQQQRDYLEWTQNRPSHEANAGSEEGGTSSADEETQVTRGRRAAHVRSEALCPRFRKIECCAKGEVRADRSGDADWRTDASQLEEALDQEVTRARRVVAQDPERFRCSCSEDMDVDVPLDALESDDVYRRFLETLRVDALPTWRWRVVPDTRPSDDLEFLVFSLQLANTSPIDPTARHLEGFFFETNAAFIFTEIEVKPFELAVVPRGFRYDRRILSKGFNCHIEQTGNSPPTFLTTHTPTYTQMRYVTRTDPPARFADLADNPVPILETIQEAMEAYRSVWAEERQRYMDRDPEWEASFGDEFNHDFAIYEGEIDRFRQGVELLRSDPDIRRAFELTNRTFMKGGKDSWRLFQLVFLVSEIPGIAALAPEHSDHAAERRIADILYFPTGGGKTEAYLGLIVFHCFYDRLRGKRGGVAAWTRFPLRLLTLQQTQRAADVIGIAELVRREDPDPRLSGANVDGFAVGYFVGEGGSPNAILPPSAQQEGGADALTWSIANDPQQRQRWKRVVSCPSCRTDTVEVDFDSNTIRLLHRCKNETCEFPDGILPVYVVDNEIYRYLPSLVVGTVDKLAGLGNQRKMSMLFGAVDGFCPEHGYFKGICCQKGCTARNQWVRSIPEGVSGVTLFVQDELHLLKEGLGTFDAHYESFAQRVRREFGHNDELKIIASSATVEAFERQVEHLYGRNRQDARRFPGPGPTLHESFYAETLGYPQRVFVGILPHNKTILRAMLELIQYYHETMLTFERTSESNGSPYRGSLLPGSVEYASLMDLYRTSLTYFIAKRHVSEVHTDIEGDINRVLAACNLPPLNILELTGDTPTDDVAVVLRHLEEASSPGAAADSVLATSMVSHGVDIDRLNAMLFYGMPRLNAEYIQASSRIGRSHVGIVFTCFHPVRERDQSHYEYFVKNHEFLGQLIEPVAINRWSRFSVNHTLPGLFMAVLLQIIANREQTVNPNRYYLRDHVVNLITSGQLGPDEFIQMLSEAYGVVDASTPGPLAFLQEIQRRIPIFLYDQISVPGTGTWVSGALSPSPMRSLRDVDDPVLFELDSLGSDWARISGGD